MTDAGHAALAARFYQPGCFLGDPEARAGLLALLRPLEQIKWNMDVHYEWALRERKKQQQQQQSNG